MKDVNKILKNKKLSNEEKVELIIRCGLTQQQVIEIMTPNFMGNIGKILFILLLCNNPAIFYFLN